MEDLSEIYKQHADMLYRFLLSKTRDPLVAEELTQETFFQALKSLHTFDGSAKISTWLCAIAKHLWLAHQKKCASNELPDYFELYSDSAENEVLKHFDQLTLYRSLHQMPEPMKEILHLRLFSNLSFKDIGLIMGKSEVWARVNYYRGKEKLVKEMTLHE